MLPDYYLFNNIKEVSSMSLLQKITVTAMLVLNTGLMFLPWFGGRENISEISGTIVLTNPIVIISILAVLSGVWLQKLSKISFPLIYTGVGAIICTEIYYWATWYTVSIFPSVNLFKSLMLAYPAFYVGIITSVTLFTTVFLFGYCKYKKEENTGLPEEQNQPVC